MENIMSTYLGDFEDIKSGFSTINADFFTCDFEGLSSTLTSALSELADLAEQTKCTDTDVNLVDKPEVEENANDVPHQWMEDLLENAVSNHNSPKACGGVESRRTSMSDADSGLWSPASINSVCPSPYVQPDVNVTCTGDVNVAHQDSTSRDSLFSSHPQESNTSAQIQECFSQASIQLVMVGQQGSQLDTIQEDKAMPASQIEAQSPVSSQKATADVNCITHKQEVNKGARAKKATNMEKPAESYIALIAKAILNNPRRKVLLADIYSYVTENYPYYKQDDSAWKSSLRHNLSVNDCFIKAGRADTGRGYYWSVHPACAEAFRQGDFRRREARRRAQKSYAKSKPCSEVPMQNPTYHPYARHGMVQTRPNHSTNGNAATAGYDVTPVSLQTATSPLSATVYTYPLQYGHNSSTGYSNQMQTSPVGNIGYGQQHMYQNTTAHYPQNAGGFMVGFPGQQTQMQPLQQMHYPSGGYGYTPGYNYQTMYGQYTHMST